MSAKSYLVIVIGFLIEFSVGREKAFNTYAWLRWKELHFGSDIFRTLAFSLFRVPKSRKTSAGGAHTHIHSERDFKCCRRRGVGAVARFKMRTPLDNPKLWFQFCRSFKDRRETVENIFQLEQLHFIVASDIFMDHFGFNRR